MSEEVISYNEGVSVCVCVRVCYHWEEGQHLAVFALVWWAAPQVSACHTLAWPGLSVKSKTFYDACMLSYTLNKLINHYINDGQFIQMYLTHFCVCHHVRKALPNSRPHLYNFELLWKFSSCRKKPNWKSDFSIGGFNQLSFHKHIDTCMLVYMHTWEARLPKEKTSFLLWSCSANKWPELCGLTEPEHNRLK